MAQMQLSGATYEWLKSFAEPFEDTPEDALRKVLALAEQQRQAKGGEPSPARPSAAAPVVARDIVARDSGRRGRTTHVLEQNGVFKTGTELVLLVDRLPGSMDASDRKFRAVVGKRPRARQNVRWLHDGRHYSLSALTERIRDDHDVALPKGGLNGYLHWGLAEDDSRSLWEIAEQARKIKHG